DLYRYMRDARKAINENRPVRLNWVDTAEQGRLGPDNHIEDAGKPYLSFIDGDEGKRNWKEAESVISQARVKGRASRVVEDCCLYVVFLQWDATESPMDIAQYRRLSTLLKKTAKDPTPDRLRRVKESPHFSRDAYEWLSEVMDDFLEDPGELRAVRPWDVDLATRPPIFLPIPLFELDRSMILDFLVDRIVFLVQLRFDRLCNKLEKLGFRIVAGEKEEGPIVIWRDQTELELSRVHLLDRIGLEFLSVESFCRLITKALKKLEDET
ncbi:MAG: hypothetical protein ACE5KV_06190, partial [Thermoplasmata archaeon]